ncbi:MAG: tRNA uridine-5-carboxymethylaminomethyl(34) synthesis GTPase MnmE [Bacteroidales bacterium]|nr:tRNA uridine-5-carboxymethylaminomethyl(34) synthesis GTPase MnmE [Bacteroidales bacterium]
MLINRDDTIVAPATNTNISAALGIIRLSGKQAIEIADKVFVAQNKKLNSLQQAKANHTYFGTIEYEGKTIDEVVLSVYFAPHSFTGENLVEISFHGSLYICQTLLNMFISLGARMAEKGEFSERAFLNGKINLSQAEAIADVIASRNGFSLDMAMNQLRGGYNDMLHSLREKFLKVASLLELEIDFSEEHEIFVDREKLLQELNETQDLLTKLCDSFKQANAFKQGIPVAIVGKPNSGKSTLMNAILKEERVIVSNIAGTTIDTIEERFFIKGVEYRFIDTAGIRESRNEIEKQGIERSFKAIEKAMFILVISDISEKEEEWEKSKQDILKGINLKDKKLIHILNKEDKAKLSDKEKEDLKCKGYVIISAKEKHGLEFLLEKIESMTPKTDFNNKVFLSNTRHYQIMNKALEEIKLAIQNVEAGISSDLIAENIRMATNYIGEITGEVCNEDILGNIFSNFCIGK